MSASNGTRRLDWILSPEPSLDHRGPGAGFSVSLEQLGALTREVRRAGPGVEVLATWEGRMVAAREGGVLVTAFHPELTDDTRVHEPFITMIRRREGAAQPRAAGQPSRAVAAPANR